MNGSSLATIKVPAYVGNYTKGRNGHNIKAITIHHMAGRLSAQNCGRIFQTVGRNGSSHYGIGYDGAIAQYVSENDTAWTNSNWNSNLESVTIETSDNDSTWYVNDTTLNSLIRLVADIAKRNRLGILVKGRNVTWHSMFANTDCPGKYLLSKMDYIISEANKLNTGTSTSSEPNYTGTIVYQACCKANGWLPEVRKCDNTPNGYVGIAFDPICCFRCKPQYGEIIYQAHTLGVGWNEPVSSKNYGNGTTNSYGGILGKPIDMIKIKSTRGWVKYRVKTKEDGWLAWVDSRTETGTESYGGIAGHEIIGIQMY